MDSSTTLAERKREEYAPALATRRPKGRVAEALVLTADECAALVAMPSAWAWSQACRKNAAMPQPKPWPTPASKNHRWLRSQVVAYVESYFSEP